MVKHFLSPLDLNLGQGALFGVAWQAEGECLIVKREVRRLTAIDHCRSGSFGALLVVA